MKKIKKEKQKIDISIVIVSYNCKEYLQKCLLSVQKESKNSGLIVETIVADNDSSDGTKKMQELKKYDWVQWINAKNNGFGAGNNIGMKKAKGKFIFLLNPDTELKKNCLWKMFEYMQMNEEIGVLGPRVVYGDNTAQITAYDNFPGLWSAFLENTLLDRLFYRVFPKIMYPGKLFSRELHDRDTRDVAHLLGAAIMVRHVAYEIVGDFDEQFFLFREETDWQYRIKNAGWRIVYMPKATIVHYEGKSTGEARFKKENWMKKLNLYLPSVYKYQRKWGGMFSEWILWMIYTLGSVWTIFVLIIIWVLNNVFGWLVNDFRKKVNRSVVDIIVYHWAILVWHIRKVFA